MHNRRDFLKLLGFAVGASLTGCGGSNGGFDGIAPLPNAYQFVPILSSGGTLPNRASVAAQATGGGLPFTGAVMVNDRRHICFHAVDQTGLDGVYQVDYDIDGAFEPARTILKEGDTLPDGSIVADIAGGALNSSDDLALVVKTPEGKEILEYSHHGENFVPLCFQFEELSDEVKLYGNLHSEVALSENADIMFGCNYRDSDGYAMGEGLFLIPNEKKSETRMVISQGQLLPGTNSAIKTFGLFDIVSDGSYIVHGAALPLEVEPARDGVALTYLVRGRVGETPETLFSHPSLGGGSLGSGSIYMAPRLGDRRYGAILQTSEAETSLWVDGEKLLDAEFENGGAVSPRGSRIISMFPPVFGPNGLMALVVFTVDGVELLVSRGGRFQTILGSGDVIEGRIVSTILFGALPDCINSHGEIVSVVYYTDGSSAVLLGIPI
jgi:hypothetical protein